MLRIVVSAKDPGVPNWLDTAGYPSGAVQGRWTDCDSQPMPTVRKVTFNEVRSLLPADTPVVTLEQRERQIRDRRALLQQRPLWCADPGLQRSHKRARVVDRKRVEQGKSVSVRVAHGGR